MGRATRWFKSLFRIKLTTKDKELTGHSGREPAGFCHNPATIPPNITPAEAAWHRSFYADNGKDQNNHAIAVAAATAAAADAAIAAAQAAVAVVHLTSQGRATVLFAGSREKWAASRIQAVFRGFLARKALRALKGLVKIQALVRGFLVRKQAAATLHSMQAIIRAQASVRANKLRRLIHNQDTFPPQVQARIPLVQNHKYKYEMSDQYPPASLHSTRLSASFDSESPKIVEVDTGCRSRPATTAPRFACPCSGPAKSDSPNYMAKTQSFAAKLRSQSAPRQRPEPGPRRRLSLNEMMESRNSLSGVRMQTSCSQAVTFKNAVMGTTDYATENRFYPN